MSTPTTPGQAIERMHRIMKKLRAPGGCPWDAEQTYSSLRRYIMEEALETIEAIDGGRSEKIEEELGDLLLQVVFQAVIGEERGEFSLVGIIEGICEKLIRRHPHVFGEVEVDGADEVVKNWKALKKEEKGEKGESSESILDGLPAGAPALFDTLRISERVASVGFDWPDETGLWDKIEEEKSELREAIAEGDREHIEEEMGDYLFIAANLARRLKVNPETALMAANRKFRRRFKLLEKQLDPTRRRPDGLYEIDYLENLWNEAKKEVG